MIASEIRAELLKDHAGLRSLITEVRLAITLVGPQESTTHELRRNIERLARALGGHNQREEAMLQELLKSVDAWGPARAEIMDETHHEEHAELVAALVLANAADPIAAGVHAKDVIERLEVHMAREEEVLLAEDVLRDDQVVIDAFGG